MKLKFAAVRLDKITGPSSQPRDKYTPAGRANLKASLDQFGVLVPVALRHYGKGQYAPIDGATRLQAIKELGWPGDTMIPAVIFDGDENDAIAAGMAINQNRERLSKLCELQGLRTMVKNGLTQSDAAKRLGRTHAWASQLLSIDRLPKSIRKQIESFDIPTSHALVMAKYVDRPDIIDLLLNHSMSGDASVSSLKHIAAAALERGIAAGDKTAPVTKKSGKRSWVRREPIRDGVRLEIHLNSEDDLETVLTTARRLAKQMRHF